MRLKPLNAASGILLNFSQSDDLDPGLYAASTSPDRIQPFPFGTVVAAVAADGPIYTANRPNWGMCELVYVRHTGSATVNPGRLLHVDKDMTILDVPTGSSNSGRPVFVALTQFRAGNVTPQGGWVLRSGLCPVQFAVAATAGQVFCSGATAGQATPTAAAGRQLLNATTLIAAAGSFTQAVKTTNGSNRLAVPSTAGVFIGQAVSGSGIPGSTTVSAIDPSGRYVTMSANATASASVTGTFTHTGFGIVHVDRPFLQGQIT